MQPTLRQRKKAQTIAKIQSTAMRLFRARGYRNVTIEQVAAEAEVAPATVYRYFETKTGFFTVDTHNTIGQLKESLGIAVVEHPEQILGEILGHLQPEATERFLEGMEFVLIEPEVRQAVVLDYIRMADEFAQLLHEEKDILLVTAKARSRAVFIGFLTAAEQWQADGRKAPLADYLSRIDMFAGATLGVDAVTNGADVDDR